MPASSLDVFVDSNCWLYLYLSEQDPSKRDRLLDCLASCERPIISTQVLTEIGANLCNTVQALTPNVSVMSPFSFPRLQPMSETGEERKAPIGKSAMGPALLPGYFV